MKRIRLLVYLVILLTLATILCVVVSRTPKPKSTVKMSQPKIATIAPSVKGTILVAPPASPTVTGRAKLGRRYKLSTTRYIASGGSYSGTDVHCAGQSYITPAAWNALGGSLAPDDVSWVCGSFTGTGGSTLLTFPNSGTSGHPIILNFASDADLAAPYWNGSNGAVSCNGKSYVTVNGEGAGIIENTANGTNLANHQQTYGIGFTSCTHVIVENLIIRNIYVNAGTAPQRIGRRWSQYRLHCAEWREHGIDDYGQYRFYVQDRYLGVCRCRSGREW